MLSTLRDALSASGRLLVVLGCGGERDAAKRPLMGAAAARLADLAVLTSDNPRSEDPQEILDQVVAGAQSVPVEQRGEVVVQIDRAAAIGLAVSRARPGDVLVVAGKGHEQGQEIAGVVHPFDDRTALRAELAAHGFAGAGR
jgi:UDP-N-acetylmuramoyl-L-alanyl-D-glutamate--2,6-diaminopimelate ligase